MNTIPAIFKPIIPSIGLILSLSKDFIDSLAAKLLISKPSKLTFPTTPYIVETPPKPHITESTIKPIIMYLIKKKYIV